MSCGQACDGCNERAQHHLCPACANEDIDNLKKELQGVRAKCVELQAIIDHHERKDGPMFQAHLAEAKALIECDEARAEVERLRSTLRLLWEQAVDICGPAGATIRRAFTDECRAAVAAALGEDALKEGDL